MRTLINVILDASGSMEVQASDVVGGFNRFLEDQKAGPDPCRMIMTMFNTVCVSRPAAPIADVPPLTKATYVPAGGTALLDAIAQSVALADHAKLADERVLVLVITDGMENASKETTIEQTKALIEEREKRGDWTFTYLGVGIEKFAKESGVNYANTAAYNAADPKASFVQMSQSTGALRNTAEAQSKSFYDPANQTPTPDPKP